MAAVSADHIVPLARIIHMNNFTKLSPESIWAVVNSLTISVPAGEARPPIWAH